MAVALSVVVLACSVVLSVVEFAVIRTAGQTVVGVKEFVVATDLLVAPRAAAIVPVAAAAHLPVVK